MIGKSIYRAHAHQAHPSSVLGFAVHRGYIMAWYTARHAI